MADLNSREFSFDTSKITFNNIKTGYHVTIDDDSVMSIVISGEGSVLDSISGDNIKGTTNLTALSAEDILFLLTLQYRMVVKL